MNPITIAIGIALVLILGAKGVLTIFVGIPLIIITAIVIVGYVITKLEERKNDKETKI